MLWQLQRGMTRLISCGVSDFRRRSAEGHRMRFRRARIQLEHLSRSSEFENLLEFIRTEDDICFACTPSRWNVLDGFSREHEPGGLRVEVGGVLVDEPLDVELTHNRAPARCVEAEDGEILVRLTLRVLVLGLIDALVLCPNEPRIQNAHVLALNSCGAWLPIRRPLPPPESRVGEHRIQQHQTSDDACRGERASMPAVGLTDDPIERLVMDLINASAIVSAAVRGRVPTLDELREKHARLLPVDDAREGRVLAR